MFLGRKSIKRIKYKEGLVLKQGGNALVLSVELEMFLIIIFYPLIQFNQILLLVIYCFLCRIHE